MAIASILSVPTLLLAASLPSLALCDRGAPEPRGFHSRGFGFVAEVFPGESRNNNAPEPLVYMYEVAYPGTAWEVEATRRWSAVLPNPDFLNEAVVSMQGHLVALDDYDEVGRDYAVALFGSLGKRLAHYRLSELLTEAEISNFDWSDCGIDWRDGARYFFLLEASPRFYMALQGELVLEFDLQTGEMKLGEASAFPDLRQVLDRRFPNEEAEVWSTSLRFSSITDGMETGKR